MKHPYLPVKMCELCVTLGVVYLFEWDAGLPMMGISRIIYSRCSSSKCLCVRLKLIVADLNFFPKFKVSLLVYIYLYALSSGWAGIFDRRQSAGLEIRNFQSCGHLICEGKMTRR